MHLLCVGRQAQLTRLQKDGFPPGFLVPHRRMRILGACYHAVSTTNACFPAGMGKGSGELPDLSLLNFWLALVAACAAKRLHHGCAASAAPGKYRSREACALLVGCRQRGRCARGKTRPAGHGRGYASPSWRPHGLCGSPEEFPSVCPQLKRCEWAAPVKGHSWPPVANGQVRRCFGFLTCIVLACAVHVCGAEAVPVGLQILSFSYMFSFPWYKKGHSTAQQFYVLGVPDFMQISCVYLRYRINSWLPIHL